MESSSSSSTSSNSLVEKYLEQMSAQDKKAYDIARQHLQSSFNVLKSNGFIQWQKNQDKGKKP